jgi:Fe-S-cluster containining protein
VETPDGALSLEIALADRPMRLSELVSAFVSVSDRSTELAIARSEREGRAISCREGCAACCRQLVPVSPPEAFRLAEVVDASPRRDALLAAFESARDRLDRSPLGRALDAAHIDEARALEIALMYPRLRIDCPLLAGERCSIYADRPVVCREYVVVTPAEHCTMPSPGRPVRRVPIPLQLSEALARVSAQVLGGDALTIPLARALAYARLHQADAARAFAPDELASRLIAALRTA